LEDIGYARVFREHKDMSIFSSEMLDFGVKKIQLRNVIYRLPMCNAELGLNSGKGDPVIV